MDEKTLATLIFLTPFIALWVLAMLAAIINMLREK